MYIYIHTQTHLHIYTYIHTNVRIHPYIHIQRDREREREREKWTLFTWLGGGMRYQSIVRDSYTSWHTFARAMMSWCMADGLRARPTSLYKFPLSTNDYAEDGWCNRTCPRLILWARRIVTYTHAHAHTHTHTYIHTHTYTIRYVIDFCAGGMLGARTLHHSVQDLE